MVSYLLENLSLGGRNYFSNFCVAAQSEGESLSLEVNQSRELQVVQEVVDDDSHLKEGV